jgi:hypothetical protein
LVSEINRRFQSRERRLTGRQDGDHPAVDSPLRNQRPDSSGS